MTLPATTLTLIELEQLYTHAPVGLCLVDRDLRYVRINERLAEMNGASVQDHIGRPVREMNRDIADTVESLYRRVIERGEPVVNFEITGRTRRNPEPVWLVSYYPVVDSGEVVGVHAVIQDVSERRRLQREILRITEAQQRQIGQELHDVSCQDLTGLGYLARSIAESLAERGDESAATIHKIADGIESVLGQLRIFSKGLIPVQVNKDACLTNAIFELTEQYSRLGDVVCTFENVAGVHVKNGQIANALFRIVRESITNALKHGRAERIDVRLDRRGEFVCLTIADDGHGFEQSAKNQGVGTRIMAYRAEIIGAHLEISSGPERGTIVRCTIPQEKIA